MNRQKLKNWLDKYSNTKGLIENLKDVLAMYDQTADAYDLVEGVREIVEDYE